MNLAKHTVDEGWWKDYLFKEVDNRERLALRYQCYKPSFRQTIQKVLDQYGLAAKLQLAKTRGTKCRILNLACGEGYFLHDLAALLEERGLREAAQLTGIDINSRAVITAEELCELSSLPRPYLSFYHYDYAQPLEKCLGLQAEGPIEFDFIFGLNALDFLPEAKAHLSHYYKLLTAGGILFMRSVVTSQGGQGWISPHPTIEPFFKLGMNYLAALNQGVDVATNQSEWLRELGAGTVEDIPVPLVGQGDSVLGIQILRLILLNFQGVAPVLIQKGLCTQNQYDEAMAKLFQEFGKHLKGQLGLVDTLACKPKPA